MALESNEEHVIPPELQGEWESYNDACMSLDVIPNKRRFLRYNELYPLTDDKSRS